MKIVFMFPGYGSQFVGMGKELYDESRIMQEYFEQAASCVDINFVKLCFASSDLEIAKISYAYSSIFLLSSAIFSILKEEGIVPDVVVGYNGGEFSAIHASGAMSFADGLYILNKYLSFYEELLASSDVSFIKVTGIKGETLQQICEQHSTNDTSASVAVHVTDNEHIVSGHTCIVDQVGEAVKKHEAKVEHCGAEIGLHSERMRPVLDSVKMYLEKIDFEDAQIPVLSTTEIHTVKKGQSIRASVLEYISSPLLWNEALDYLHDYDVLVEIGPGTKLSSMAKKQYPDKIIMSVNTREDIEKLKMIVKVNEENPNEEPSEE